MTPSRREEDRKDRPTRSGDDSPAREQRRPRDEDAVELDATRGVFMISVAAELAGMHPQTLRMYEARGLVTPKRSPKQTRLYSQEDVELLRKIQRLTTEEGLNLAGVETVLQMEQRLERMRSELARMRRRAGEIERQMADELERVRKSFRAELVPYGAYEPKDIVPAKRAKPVKIRIERPGGGREDGGETGGPERTGKT